MTQQVPEIQLVWETHQFPVGLVFNVDHIKSFRENLRILGVLVGTLATYPQQNLFLSVPLRLLVFECLRLLELGAARFKAHPRKQSSVECAPTFDLFDELLKICIAIEKKTTGGESRLAKDYDIYRHLLDKGYYISPGLRFGGDFVLYPGDPLKFHSYSIVRLNFARTNDLVVGGRLATGVKKNLVVVDQDDDHTIRAYSIQWAGFG